MWGELAASPRGQGGILSAIENALGSASTREPLNGLKRWTSLHPGQFATSIAWVEGFFGTR